MSDITSTKVLLVDWDDVLMNRTELARQQHAQAQRIFGNEAEAVWQDYEAHRLENNGAINVDEFINSINDEIKQQKMWEVFYGKELDFSACVDRAAWQELRLVAESAGVNIKIFTEGSRKYQYYKIATSGLDIPDDMIGVEGVGDVFKNKMGKFQAIVEALNNQGTEVIGYVDDRISKLTEAYSISSEVKYFWFNRGTAPKPDWITAEVGSLREMATILKQGCFGPERQESRGEKIG